MIPLVAGLVASGLTCLVVGFAFYVVGSVRFSAARATLREAQEANRAANEACAKAQTYFAAALKLEDEAAQLAGAKIIDRARESSR